MQEITHNIYSAKQTRGGVSLHLLSTEIVEAKSVATFLAEQGWQDFNKRVEADPNNERLFYTGVPLAELDSALKNNKFVKIHELEVTH